MTAGSLPAGGGAPAVDGSYSWFRLAISVALGLIGSVGMWAVVIVLPVVQDEFGVDRATASLPYTMAMIGFAIGNVAIGRLVDRIGIVVPIIAAALVLGTGFVVSAQTTAIWQFALVHGLAIGVGTAASFGPLIADISHWFRRRRGFAVAATAAGNYIGGAIWPIVLQGFIETAGWRATYIGVGLFCIATMVPLAMMLRRAAPKEDLAAASRPHLAGTLEMSPRRLQIMLAVAGIGCCVAMSMPQVHLVAYSVDLGFGARRGAEMLALLLAGGIFSRLASGFLADHIGGVRTLLAGSILQCTALAFYLPFDGLTSLYLVSFGFGLAQGGIVPSYAIIVREYLPAHEAGHRIGLVIMATISGMAFGGWLSGWLNDATGSYQAAFVNGIVWNLLNISIMATLLWRIRKPAAVPA